MAVLPATGSEMTMGRIVKAYTNALPSAGSNISLSGTIGGYLGRSAGTTTSLSTVMGGQITPYTY
jgi:hypothetical protein